MKSCEELRTRGTVAIVGAGPAGATLGRLLQQRGFSVTLYERDASSTARSQGGSLDLRRDAGQRAVDAAGLGELFAKHSRDEAKAFRMLDDHGAEIPGGADDTHEEPGPEIDRGDLRQLLLDSLAPGTIAWGHAVNEVCAEPDGRWRLTFADRPPVVADLVVGADGVGSKVRAQLTSIKPTYIGMSMLAAIIRKDLWRGSALDKILGEGSVMYAGGQKTIFVQRCARDLILLYYSVKGPKDWPESAGFSLEDTGKVLEAVKADYAAWSPDVVEMLTQVEGKIQRWPLSVMPPDIHWASKPGLTMVGDSSHAMPPFTGKGVNLAMLDSLELADGLIADLKADFATTIATFEKRVQDRTKKEIAACLEIGSHHYGIDIDFGSPGGPG